MRRGIAWRLACDNEEHAHAVRDRAFERAVEIGMCADQIMPVKIDTSFRPDEPPPEAAIIGRRGLAIRTGITTWRRDAGSNRGGVSFAAPEDFQQGITVRR